MADMDGQSSDEEVCEKVSDTDEDHDEYVFAPIGECVVSTKELSLWLLKDVVMMANMKPVGASGTYAACEIFQNPLFIGTFFFPYQTKTIFI